MSDNYFVSWKEQYNIHIDEIDCQHQVLVAHLRRLQEAMWEGRGREVQNSLIEGLVGYIQEHFRFEENMLRERGYESLSEHIEQHKKLSTEVFEFRQKIHDGEAVSNAALVLFLRNWFTNHIMQHDQKYAHALRAKAPAGTVGAATQPTPE